MRWLRTLEGHLPEPVRRHGSLLAILVIALPYIVIVTLLHTRAVSPIDEWVYLDYLQKVPTQGFVHEGEQMSQESLDLMACVGTSPFGPVGPPCDHHYAGELGKFPNQGLTSASPYTPLYFDVTWVLGGGLHLIGLDLVDGWRLTGVLWLIGSILVLFRLFRQLGVRHGPSFAIALAYVASPYSWWTYSYVSTDAPAVLVGGLLLSLAIDLARGRRTGWAIAIAAFIGTMIKLTNAIGVALALLYLAIVAVRRVVRREPGSIGLVWPPLLGLVAGVAGQLAWTRFIAATAVSAGRVDQGVGAPLDWKELLLQTTNFLPGTITSNPLGLFLPGFVYTPLNWLCVAGVLGGALYLRLRHPASSMMLAVAIASVVAAPMLAIALDLVTGTYFQLPPRYGATMLPGMLLLVALLLRWRIATATITLYAAALVGVGLWLSAFLARLA